MNFVIIQFNKDQEKSSFLQINVQVKKKENHLLYKSTSCIRKLSLCKWKLKSVPLCRSRKVILYHDICYYARKTKWKGHCKSVNFHPGKKLVNKKVDKDFFPMILFHFFQFVWGLRN